MKRFGVFVILCVMCVATVVSAIGPPPELSNRVVGRQFFIEDGTIDTIKFVKGDGLAVAQTAFPFNIPGDGTDADVRSSGVYIESMEPFHYIAYYSNFISAKGDNYSDGGPTDYYTEVDTSWGYFPGNYQGVGVKTVEKFPCRIFINAELDSISFREAAGNDSTMVWALF